MAAVSNRWVGLSSLIYALAAPAVARAQEGAPPVNPTPGEASFAEPSEQVAPTPAPSEASTVSSQRHAAWQLDYSAARKELLAGHFASAARRFGLLAASASDPFDQRLATEQAALASDWSTRHLVLSLASDRRKDSAPVSGARTTDEISILYTNAAVYGIGSGVALATFTEPDSAAAAIFPTLALAGGAIGAVALADASPHEFRYGVPQSIVAGMYIGLDEGLTWVIWNQARARYDEEWEGSTVAALIWGSATLGAGAGAVLGSVRGTTPGRASFVGSSALWAGTIAGLVAGSFGAEEDDTRDDHALLAAAIGVNAGAVTGMLAAGSVSPSIARVRYLDLGAVGGGLVVGGVYVALADKDLDSRALMASTALGAGVGLAASYLMTRGMPKDLGPDEQHEASVVQSLRPTFMPLAGGGGLSLSGQL